MLKPLEASTASVESTIGFIQKLYAGKFDAAGNDYYHNNVSIMYRLPKDADNEVKISALLYGIMENINYTRQYLSERGFSERVLDAVEVLGRSQNDKRDRVEIVNDIISSGNKDAIMIEKARILSTTHPISLFHLAARCNERFVNEFKRPLQLLQNALVPQLVLT